MKNIDKLKQFRANYIGDGYTSIKLADLLAEIEMRSSDGTALREMEARKDAAYLERNQLVAALSKCFPSGVGRTEIPGWSPDWHNCVYVDLPTGQVSWHFHDSHGHLFNHLFAYGGKWDGHSTEEKYERVNNMTPFAFADVWHAGTESFYKAMLVKKLSHVEALQEPPEVAGPVDADEYEGLRGMRWDESTELIREHMAQAGFKGELDPHVWNVLHRVANGAHKKGAQEMKAILRKGSK